jgi:hypothetical protein
MPILDRAPNANTPPAAVDSRWLGDINIRLSTLTRQQCNPMLTHDAAQTIIGLYLTRKAIANGDCQEKNRIA